MRCIGNEHSTTRQKKGQWTAEEDLLLMKYIETHGEGKWGTVPQKAGLQRCAKGCRLRWRNYLRPNMTRGNISLEEEDLIIRLHKLLGNRWSLIAGRVPGRTDNEIKNYWNSCLRKKLRCNVILETPSHYKASSSPLDHLHSHSYEKDLIQSESSLPDCKMDYLDSQQHSHEGDHLKSSHFSISHITNDQIDRTSYTAKEDSDTRSSQCQSADCNGRNSCRQFFSASHDVGLSTEASQQQQPPPGHLCERNGHVFHSMAVMQPKYYPSPSLCVDGGIDHHDEIWDCNDLGCTDMQDPPQLPSYDALLSTFCEHPITTGFGDFGGDVQSMNSILGWDNIHDNFNTIEENPCHDLYIL